MPPRAVVMTCDRWHLDFVGCYGNDWIETPNLQKLAAQGVVFDRHFAANVDPEFASLAWWTGRTQLPRPVDSVPSEWDVGRLSAAGVRTVLFVEASEENASQASPPFDEIIVITGRDDLEAQETETPFPRLVTRVEEWLVENASDERPTLLWLRSRGVPIPWLPPLGFADLYLDDFGLAVSSEPVAGDPNEPEMTFPEGPEYDDAELVEFAEEQDLSPEQNRVPEDTRYALAMYAAYASLLDRWIGRLLTKLDANVGWKDALLVFAAATGQPFFLAKEDGASDLSDLEQALPLRGEMIQTPLIVRLPANVAADSQHAGTRRPALVQTVDLLPSVLEWFGVTGSLTLEGASVLPLVRQQVETIHDSVLIGDGAATLALCTEDYLYVRSGAKEPGAEPAVRLFEKPYDRWDVSDVANQAHGLVDDLERELQERLVQQNLTTSIPSAAISQ